MPTILDFQIQPLSAESYSLTVCERGSSQPLATSTFRLRVDFLTDFSVDRLNASTQDAGERFDKLKEKGQELYRELFPPAVEQVWQEYKQRSEFLILCLRFDEGATKLEVLPWETLHDGAEFIAAGAKTTLTRLPLDVTPPSDLPPIPRPLKLFGFFASPLDLQDHERLNAEREQEILLEAINDPAAEGRISADFEDEAKLEILERSLRAELAGSGGYHILHFTGHGISPREGGGLLLEDAHGKKLPTPIADVMQAIQRGQDGKAKLRLAVISGCQTARTLHTQGFSDLARELLRQRVPAVIAMQFSITDEGGLKFAEVLYREIAKGVELEHAVHAARGVLLADQRFFINNDALAIVLLASDGACLQTTEAQSPTPQAEASATYLGDRLDPLAQGFYGRRREYRKIRDALLHQDQRAVIIHGIGGIGKTALLTHSINRLRPHFKDVMSFDCRRAALAPETILLELHRYFAAQGMPQLQSLIGQNVPPETLADEIAQVLMQLTEKPMLIVFDNFESQLDERREFINEDLRVFLTSLLQATGTGSQFLFTTRYLFDLDSEIDRVTLHLLLDDLSHSEALFLMQRLENLAAAPFWLKLATLEVFGCHPHALIMLNGYCSNQSLSQALRTASNLRSTLHESLAIEMNYRQISKRARNLLDRLAAFHTTFSFEAAEWVIGEKVSYAEEFLQEHWGDLDEEMKAMDRKELLQVFDKVLPERRQSARLSDQIGELTSHSLLTTVLKGETDDTDIAFIGLLVKSLATNSNNFPVSLYSVHPLVRDFCFSQLKEKKRRKYLREAAAFITTLTDGFRRQHGDVNVPSWVIVSDTEAIRLLMEAEDYTRAARVLVSIHPTLERAGLSKSLVESYYLLLGKLDSYGDATIKHNLATLLTDYGDYETALKYHKEALKIKKQVGDRKGVASSLHNIGNIHYRRCDFEEALEHYNKSLKISEELDDVASVARVLGQIGIIYQGRAEHERALDYFKRGLQLNKELNDRDGLAHSLHNIGNHYFHKNEYREALEYYQQSFKIKEELGDLAGLAKTLGQIGQIHGSNGEYEQAIDHYQKSLQIVEEIGDLADKAMLLRHIGKIYQESGDYNAAYERFQHSLEIAEELGDQQEKGLFRNYRKLHNIL